MCRGDRKWANGLCPTDKSNKAGLGAEAATYWASVMPKTKYTAESNIKFRTVMKSEEDRSEEEVKATNSEVGGFTRSGMWKWIRETGQGGPCWETLWVKTGRSPESFTSQQL